jgi:hypothetical protein
MPRCESCGNDYDKSFQILAGGKSHTFDSFECAIQALAPTCEHCGVRIVGHGLEKDACSAASIAPRRRESRSYATALDHLGQPARTVLSDAR